MWYHSWGDNSTGGKSWGHHSTGGISWGDNSTGGSVGVTIVQVIPIDILLPIVLILFSFRINIYIFLIHYYKFYMLSVMKSDIMTFMIIL